jgi:hypothetical protein
MPRSLALLALLAGLVIAMRPAAAVAGVIMSKDEALESAFPAGVAVDPVTVFLTDAQLAQFRSEGAVAPESKLFTYYRGTRDGALVGYAVITSHVVRTMPEAFMVILTPDGTIDRVVMLAFYEPPEYQPPTRWLEQFHQRRMDGSPWRIGNDLHGLSGATLTANAIRDGLRTMLVLHKLVMRPAGAP